MDFSSINPIGIAVATLAGFVIGALWFSPKTFFTMWWNAMGKGDAQPGDGQNMGVVFASLVVALIIQAVVLSGLINGLYDHSASVAQGVLVGAVLGLGISAMHSLGHRLFAGQGWLVWALEIGNDVVAAMGMAAIITLIN
jgi:hypothetical protein